jgi:hypothetical protein
VRFANDADADTAMNALNNEEYVIALPYDMCAEQSAPILSPKGGTS